MPFARGVSEKEVEEEEEEEGTRTSLWDCGCSWDSPLRPSGSSGSYRCCGCLRNLRSKKEKRSIGRREREREKERETSGESYCRGGDSSLHLQSVSSEQTRCRARGGCTSGSARERARRHRRAVEYLQRRCGCAQRPSGQAPARTQIRSPGALATPRPASCVEIRGM
jgi:hypothetical protein